MKSENDIITDTDLIALTGYKTPSKQCKILRAAGIFFITRRDGRPRTTWAHFNEPCTKKHMTEESKHVEPNYGALD
ncbi:DUF4224 domain-containing protein [Sodalis praecaptivus]|uniref:DUF4224 domain-containing protein n=1 Tax=Sodalis praecaptivus TaxID=1239307 RepID=UPI00280AE04E|nr:DUF4224 domain-containing protein [Sodalis praecaptivus]